LKEIALARMNTTIYFVKVWKVRCGKGNEVGKGFISKKLEKG
jgi:hypothetical protein